MANVSYPQFNLKTIVLPLDYDFLSDESGSDYLSFHDNYKEKYGIDFDDIISFDNDSKMIVVSVKGQLLLKVVGNGMFSDELIVPYLISANDSQYSSGVSDAKLVLFIGSSGRGYGLSIDVSKNATFGRESATITIAEI